MTLDHLIASSCEGKTGFATAALARHAARNTRRANHYRRRRSRSRRQPRVHTYRCRFCRLWHVGTQEPDRIRSARTKRPARKKILPPPSANTTTNIASEGNSEPNNEK